jgi:hypothetical protein
MGSEHTKATLTTVTFYRCRVDDRLHWGSVIGLKLRGKILINKGKRLMITFPKANLISCVRGQSVVMQLHRPVDECLNHIFVRATDEFLGAGCKEIKNPVAGFLDVVVGGLSPLTPTIFAAKVEWPDIRGLVPFRTRRDVERHFLVLPNAPLAVALYPFARDTSFH